MEKASCTCGMIHARLEKLVLEGLFRSCLVASGQEVSIDVVTTKLLAFGDMLHASIRINYDLVIMYIYTMNIVVSNALLL
jgi:hypothetical protein